jgi:hypothetical protein
VVGIVLVFVSIAIGVVSNWLDKPQRLTGQVVVGLLIVLAFVSFGLNVVKDNDDAAAPPSTAPVVSSTPPGTPPVPDTPAPRSSADWAAEVNSVCREPLSRVRDEATQVKNASMDPSDEDWAMLVSTIAEEISVVLPRISAVDLPEEPSATLQAQDWLSAYNLRYQKVARAADLGDDYLNAGILDRPQLSDQISGLLEQYVNLSDTVTSKASVLGIACP